MVLLGDLNSFWAEKVSQTLRVVQPEVRQEVELEMEMTSPGFRKFEPI